jgi:Fe-S cluster assembly iron-binding protein IscA
MTQEAADAVERIVSNPGVPKGAVLRFAAGEQLQVELVDHPPASDLVVDEMRISVEPESLTYLDDKVLDAQEVGDTVEFTLFEQPCSA